MMKMMKKTVLLLSFLLLLFCAFAFSVSAISVDFDLTSSEKYRVEAEGGDEITVTFTIRRTDKDEGYSVSALQNYIEYDPAFFEFVEGSAVCNRGNGFAGKVNTIAGPRVYMTDMLDNLPAVCEFGSFRMRVLARSGESTIRCGSMIENDMQGNAFTVTAKNVTVKITEKQDTSGVCKKDASCPIAAFTDTDRKAWYHDGIHYCLEQGLMVGTGDKTFSPAMTTTRSMIVTILWRIKGEPSGSAKTAFADVKPGAWYEKPVAWANETGVALGYGNGLFGTEDPITREQLAVFLYRFADAENKTAVSALPFTDTAGISTWAQDALCWCYENGIVLGKGDGRIDPKGLASRAEAATMIQRFCVLMGY